MKSSYESLNLDLPLTVTTVIRPQTTLNDGMHYTFTPARLVKKSVASSHAKGPVCSVGCPRGRNARGPDADVASRR
jgi:hypothetical protein